MSLFHTKKWFEEAFKGCEASQDAKNASIRICRAYGIHGICDPAYIANVIDAEKDSSKIKNLNDEIAHLKSILNDPKMMATGDYSKMELSAEIYDAENKLLTLLNK